MPKKIICFSCILFIVIGLMGSCTQSTKTKTQKRVEKQKKRQKKNPNDCPQIDC
jgi:hypothetical protein